MTPEPMDPDRKRARGFRRWLRRRGKVPAGTKPPDDGPDGPPGAGVREPRRPKPSPPTDAAAARPPRDTVPDPAGYST